MTRETMTIKARGRKSQYKHLYDSYKSPTRCNNFSVYYPDAYLQLNIVSGVFPPIIRSSMTAVAASAYISM
jgi:hypothetical protein